MDGSGRLIIKLDTTIEARLSVHRVFDNQSDELYGCLIQHGFYFIYLFP